jgi:hypothetical protein
MNEQEKQEKYEWLAEFYRQAAEGGVIQFDSSPDGWRASNTGPTPGSFNLDHWRIKPALQVIDLTPLIESGLDCEFWDDSAMPFRVFKLWDIVEREGTRYLDTDGAVYWKNCQPRMKHIHYWRGEIDKCPIPEGFEVVLHLRDGSFHSETDESSEWRWINWYSPEDIIGIEFIAVRDGYTLTPTC